MVALRFAKGTFGTLPGGGSRLDLRAGQGTEVAVIGRRASETPSETTEREAA